MNTRLDALSIKDLVAPKRGNGKSQPRIPSAELSEVSEQRGDHAETGASHKAPWFPATWEPADFAERGSSGAGDTRTRDVVNRDGRRWPNPAAVGL